MIKTFLFTAFAASSLTGTAFANGSELVIKNFVGTIQIENGTSSDISITRDENMKGVNVVQQGSSLKIDGGISRPDGNKCKGYYGSYNLGIFKKEKSGEFKGYEDLENYPQLTVRAPKDTVLVIENSIPFLTAETLGGTDVKLRYCGKVKLGDVTGELRADIRGSADLEAKDVGDVDINIRGSGDLDVQKAKQVLLTVAGSGDAEFENIQRAEVSLSGSGDINIGDVNGSLIVESRGSGDFEAGDVTGDFIYDAAGSSDLDIGVVMGQRISIDVSGSVDVNIDGGEVQTLKIIASGASEVDYDGTAEDADLIATGASDISVSKVTGELRRKERGAADISVSH